MIEKLAPGKTVQNLCFQQCGRLKKYSLSYEVETAYIRKRQVLHSFYRRSLEKVFYDWLMRHLCRHMWE